MKKRIMFLLIAAAASVNVYAQMYKPARKRAHTSVAATVQVTPRPVMVKKEDDYNVLGKNFLNVGVGLGGYYHGLPFGASFEHGFTDVISAGVFVDYSSYNDGLGNVNFIYGGVRGSYHFAKLFNITDPKFDPYAGISLGYYNVGGVYDEAYSSSVFLGVHAGVRYQFSDNIGGYAEAGYGVAALQVGVTFKF